MAETRPIIALDFPDKESVAKFLHPFDQDESLYVKIGMELFYQEGPDLVRWLNSLGHDIFLDLKLHDIPNTVKSAMAGLAKLNVAMVNVHAAGGSEMMRQALEGLEAGTSVGQKRPKLIAVTQLTSTSEKMMQIDQQIMTTLSESVLHYAKITNEAGLDGVVCSAWEAADIKKVTRTDFLCCTPGIRLTGAATDDQQRIATPQKARALKSSEIVVGRPITKADQPVIAYHEIKNAWNGVEE